MEGADDKSENISLRVTEDGSHTLFSRHYNQQYHSNHGAITESRHLFFKQNGLTKALQKQDQINILEIGFGTGLNLTLLMENYLLLNSNAPVKYVSVESHPVPTQLVKKLNYGDYLNHAEIMEKLPKIFGHLNKGMNHFSLIPGLSLSLFNGSFKAFKPKNLQFDFIFQDAFSPSENPELWKDRVFSRLLKWCKPRGILTTYCAASKVRGAMATAGWKVARADGAPGKREMTIASPTEQPLVNFKRVNEKTLGTTIQAG